MDNAALKRLRLGFVLLGVLLLAPLYFVLRTTEARLEAQRRLRHEIVAARIFDEMDRVPFKDHVWPKFLYDNAAKLLKLPART